MKKLISVAAMVLATIFVCQAQERQVNAMVDLVGAAGGGKLVKPVYQTRETGIVIVKIVVDKQGKVIKAIPGQVGSDTSDPILLASAREAALKSSFKMKEDIQGERTGTITYGFGVEVSTNNVKGKGVDTEGYISIADLLDYHTDGIYCVRGVILGFADEKNRSFYIQQREDEILPIQLADNAEAAEVFNSLIDLPQYSEIEVKGTLAEITFEEETLKGLINAEVLNATPAESTPAESAQPKKIIETRPLFQGKELNYFAYWVSRKLVYPKSAKRKGIQGTVVLSFMIDKDGSVTNVKVVKSIDPALDKEAVRVVSSSPKWTPGSQNGEPVRCSFRMPIVFAP